MISYGSQHSNAATPFQDRSHQLGEGQSINTGMSGVVHPSRPVLGSQGSDAEMPMRDCSQGEGHSINTEMSYPSHPSRPVLRRPKIRHKSVTPTPPPPVRGGTPVDRSNARRGPSSPPVYGSLCYHAAMPIYDRSHLFTTGQTPVAEMLFENRLSREGSSCPRSNAIHGSPFPTSLRKRSWVVRSNAIPDSSFPREGSIQHCNNARIDTPFPTSFGPPPLRRKDTPPSPN